MTRHRSRLLLILMLGAWLGGCSAPSSKPSPSIPMPASGPSSENQSEDVDQPSDEQTTERRKDPSHKQQKPSDPKPETPEPVQTTVRTDDENVAVLDQQLEEALNSYDEDIHEEFEKAQAERHAHEQPAGDLHEAESGWDDRWQDDSAADAKKPGEPMAKAGSRIPSPETGEPGDGLEERGEGSENRGTHSVPPPVDIPSGEDDDVVARQLREAAQKERDPVLREKLWDEYRKYKKEQASVNPSPSGAGE